MRKTDKKHAKRDQKSELTGPSESTMQLLLAALNEGVKLSAARQLAGIPSSTFCDWMAKGKDPDNERYYAFRQAIVGQQAKVQERLTGLIQTHATEDWKAAALLLERLYPKAFGKRALPPIVVEPKGALSGTDQEQLRESIAAALASRTTTK